MKFDAKWVVKWFAAIVLCREYCSVSSAEEWKGHPMSKCRRPA